MIVMLSGHEGGDRLSLNEGKMLVCFAIPVDFSFIVLVFIRLTTLQMTVGRPQRSVIPELKMATRAWAGVHLGMLHRVGLWLNIQ